MPDLDPVYIIHHIPKTGGVSIRNWLTKHLGMHRGLVHYGVFGELFCMQHKLPFLEQLTSAQLYNVWVVMGHYVTKATADLFPDREIRRMIVLREPVTRIISQYNHAMNLWCNMMGRTQMDFHEWYETHAIEKYDYKDALRSQGMTPEIAVQSQASLGPNYMGRFISQNFGMHDWPNLDSREFAARINGLLETFWLVGLTEKLATFASVLGQELSIPADIAHFNRGKERQVYLEPSEDLIEFIRENNQADCLIYEYWKSRLESTD